MQLSSQGFGSVSLALGSAIFGPSPLSKGRRAEILRSSSRSLRPLICFKARSRRIRQASLRLRLRFTQGQVSPRMQAALLLRKVQQRPSHPRRETVLAQHQGQVSPRTQAALLLRKVPQRPSHPRWETVRASRRSRQNRSQQQASDGTPQGPPLLRRLSTHYLPARAPLAGSAYTSL